jgi:sulfate permease, SulP family
MAFSLIRDIKRLFKQNQLDIFPLRSTLKHYSADKAKSDLSSAINVSLVAFPQGMAYAMLAGLPLQYGIYCSAIAAFIAPFLASSRLTVVGPTNATAVMVLSAFLLLPKEIDRVACTSLLVSLVGIFLIVGAFLKVASLTQYVSRSVVIGYVSGAALLIIVNQVSSVLGFKLEGAATLVSVAWQTIQKLDQTQWNSLTIGLITISIYIVFNKLLPRLPTVAITLVSMGFISHMMISKGYSVALLPPIEAGHWSITPPMLSSTLIGHLAMPAMAIAFLAMLEGTFMSKTLASRTGDRVDVNQEMLSFGAANLAAAFFSGMPASGSLTRSSLNWMSGAKTGMSSLFSGLICGIAVLLVGPLIGYIPVSALAIVVIMIALSLINLHQIRLVLNATRSDALVLTTTFIAALLTPLYFAIFLGAATSIALYLRKAGSPHLVEYTMSEEGHLQALEKRKSRRHPEISIIHVEGELFFGASDLFRDEIRRICVDPSLKVVILRMRNARNLDATSILALEELIKYIRETHRHILICGATRDIYRVIRKSGLLQLLGRENLLTASRSPFRSTFKAIKRAQHLLGEKGTNVRVFYDPDAKKAAAVA